MNKIIAAIALLVLPILSQGQKIFVMDTGDKISQKLKNELQFHYDVVDHEQDAIYKVRVFFTGHYSPVKNGFKCFYKVISKKGNEMYKSDIWKSGGYGGVAENYFVKKIRKDLKEVFEEIEYQNSLKANQ